MSQRIKTYMPALLAFVLSFSALVYLKITDKSTLELAVIYPPYYSESETFIKAAKSMGYPVGQGFIKNIVRVKYESLTNRQDVIDSLYKSGAWIVFDSPTLSVCVKKDSAPKSVKAI